jgi:predicted transcriptional regulator
MVPQSPFTSASIAVILGMRYRNKTEIVTRILEVVNNGSSFGNGGVSQTTIMFKASLSHIQLHQYLMILTESDLLSYDGQTRTFKTTEKGHSLLKAYNKMEQEIKEREI